MSKSKWYSRLRKYLVIIDLLKKIIELIIKTGGFIANIFNHRK